MMRTAQTTKNLRQRKEVVDLQIRGLSVKAEFFRMGHGEFMTYITAQALNERVALRVEDRQRISQILNGNVQPADLKLLGLCERTVKTLAKAPKAAA